MGFLFWLVFLAFYLSHLNNEELLPLNDSSNRGMVNENSWIFLMILIIIYFVCQILFVVVFFTDYINYREYCLIQAGFSVFILLIISYFIFKMYKNFSGTFYITEGLKKISQSGNKTMLIILLLRFVVGLVNFGLFQTDLYNFFRYTKQKRFDYNGMLGLGIAAVNVFSLEIIPIYSGFHLQIIKLCFKINYEHYEQDSSGMKKDKETFNEIKTSLEKKIMIKVKNNKTDNAIILEKFFDNLKKFDYEE